MPVPLILGVPLIPVAVNTAAGVIGTVLATRLISNHTPTEGAETSGKSWRFWDDGIDAKEAAMIGAVGLAALGVTIAVTKGT